MGKGRARLVAGSLALFAFGGARTLASEAPGPAAVPDFTGQWAFNKEASDDARQKLRESLAERRGGGRGGGVSPAPGTPPASLGDDDMREALRPLFEPAERVTITQTPAEIVWQEEYASARTFRPNGRSYKTDNGTAELKVQWKDGRLVVEKKLARGGKLTETWELAADGARLVLSLKLDDGLRSPLKLQHVYDRQRDDSTK